jgi:alpha-tubulin suppressor-like RCC1 family protein
MPAHHALALLSLLALSCANYRPSPPPADSPAPGIQLAAEGGHVCALRTGALYCWGDNRHGQLGDGTTASRHTPALVHGMAQGVSAVATSARHTCAIKDGAVYCWGANEAGQLGDGTTTARPSPAATPTLTGVTQLAAGPQNTCAIKDGALYCWGDNPFLLSHERPDDALRPERIATLDAQITAVSLYQTTGCAIRAGALTCWDLSTKASGPQPVQGLSEGVTALSAGPQRCALQRGALRCAQRDDTSPQLVARGVDAFTSNDLHLCIIKAGALSCRGHNGMGELGDSTRRAYDGFVPVAGMQEDVTSVAAGHASICAAQRGRVRCWGDNTDGQLGAPNTSGTELFTVEGSSDVTHIASTAGLLCTIADGALRCLRDVLQETNPDEETWRTSSSFEQVEELDAQITDASIGRGIGCAIRAGALYCWGDNAYGQIGDGTTTTRATPTPVLGMERGVSAVSGAGLHTCAIKDGALYCWGYNYERWIPGCSAEACPTPTLIPELSADVQHVAAHHLHTCAIKAGALYCWGENNQGQLGDGTNLTRTKPTSVTGFDAQVSAISTGYSRTCAIKAGALYCWGNIDATSPQTAATDTHPQLISGLEDGVTHVSAGRHHTCAIRAGAAYCWGLTAKGQLGTHDADMKRDTPGLVPGLDEAVSLVHAGDGYTCAVQRGQLRCVGDVHAYLPTAQLLRPQLVTLPL